MKDKLKEFFSDKENVWLVIGFIVMAILVVILFRYINSTFIPGDVYIANKKAYLEALGKDTSNVTFCS